MLKIRNEQVRELGRQLGLNFRERLAEYLKKQRPAATAVEVEHAITAGMEKAWHYNLFSECHVATFITLTFSGSDPLPVDARSLLRDERKDAAARLAALVDWAKSRPGAIGPAQTAELSEQFSDQPAASVVNDTKYPEEGWVRVELIDEADWPAEGEEYCIKLPDGVEARGYLDSDGEVYLTGIEAPGDCRVSFPGLDRDVWEREP